MFRPIFGLFSPTMTDGDNNVRGNPYDYSHYIVSNSPLSNVISHIEVEEGFFCAKLFCFFFFLTSLKFPFGLQK